MIRCQGDPEKGKSVVKGGGIF